MDICFEGVGQVVATFRVKDDENVQTGMAVTLKDSGTVELGGKGDPLCGVTVGTERNGAAAVQISGVVKVGYSGTAPEVGWQELVCDGEGKVTTDGENGANCLVLAVDIEENTAVIKL